MGKRDKQQNKQQIANKQVADLSFGKNERNKLFLAILVCITLPFIIYSNSLHAPFILDDLSKIVQNPNIKSLNSLTERLIFRYGTEPLTFKKNDPSRPITYLTFAINYYFGGLNTFGYHIFNVSLHILNTVFIFFFMRKIIFYSLNTKGIMFPLFGALFFAAHPVNTSVVSYIFSRSDALATFFYLAAILLFIKSLEKRRVFYVFSLACFILSLFSKQISITLPATLLLIDYILLSDYKVVKVIERKYYHIPFWLLALSYVAFRYFYLGGIGDIEARTTFDKISYSITQPYVILRYVKMLLIPTGLCLDHFVLPEKSILEPKILLSLSTLIGTTITVTYAAYRKKTGFSKILLFSTLWFLIVLSPTSSFFPTTSLLVENRMYLASIGIYLIIISIYFGVFSYITEKRSLLILLISVHIGLLAITTFKRNEIYRDNVLLWEDVISKYPDNPKAYNNLGLICYEKKDIDRAKRLYERAIELYPTYDDAYGNLGLLYHNQNDFEKAKEYYLKAIQLNKRMANVYLNLGDIYNEQKDFNKAQQYYQNAIEQNPNYVNAYINLSVISGMKGKYDEAERLLNKAMELNPNLIAIYLNMGNLYYIKKDFKKALSSYMIALEKSPNNQLIMNRITLLQKLTMSYKN